MNLSSNSNIQPEDFLQAFQRNRTINRRFYELVEESAYDFKITSKSDSVKQSLLHLIDVTRDYCEGVKSGELKFKRDYPDLTVDLGKEELLHKLRESEQDLEAVLLDQDMDLKSVSVKWSSEPIPVLTMIWGLNNHEILHTGFNLAVMDCLNIERYPELKAVWG